MRYADLPIEEAREDLLEAVRRNNRLIVTAPTGSGKTTRVPQWLIDHGGLNGSVVVLQPRRLAARMLAARVAWEREVPLGSEVGYQVRFDRKAGPKTRILFETEGILLRRLLTDPTIPDVGAVILDEFHERHLYGDLTLGRMLRLQASERPDLKILVMSATLAMEPLRAFLDPCAVIEARGRTFPVDIRYLDKPLHPDHSPVWEAAAAALEDLARGEPEGDALVFMPGAYEIGRTLRAIENSPALRDFVALPLHGELSAADQDRAVSQQPRRKIVVSTNVAEASLTIDGVRLVVDSGLARIPRYDAHRGLNTLWIERISRAAADQRAGRAGRTAPGVCMRLWTAAEHAARPEQEKPEVLRLELAETVLTLKAGGVNDIRAFPWLDAPEARSLEQAELLLRDLGALDHDNRLTELGRRMAAFPTHPRHARMLLAAAEVGVVPSIALIAAILQGRPFLQRRADRIARERRDERWGGEEESDFFALMEAWRFADAKGYALGPCRALGIHAQHARQVRPVFEHMLRIAENEGLPIRETNPDRDAIRRCLLTGFSDQLARRFDRGTLRCAVVHGRKGELARESVVRDATLFVAAEIQEIQHADHETHVQLSLATAVEEAWIEAMFPADCSTAQEAAYDSVARRVVGVESRRFRDLSLSAKRVDRVEPALAARLLAEEALAGRIPLPEWTPKVDEWLARVSWLASVAPDLGLPAFDAEARRGIVERMCAGCASAKDLKQADPWPALRAWLGGASAAALERHAPERVTLSNGRSARVLYGASPDPHIALRIQELYDVERLPALAGGRVPLTVHILGPNHRPVQITRDLAGFWREHYPAVKQQLQRRYPKHVWR